MITLPPKDQELLHALEMENLRQLPQSLAGESGPGYENIT